LKVLISGFTTFSDHTENSSQIITGLLKETKIDGIEIHTVILPVAFSSAFENLKIEIDTIKPDYVICLGLAQKREAINLEKVAINLIHCDIADNEGTFLKDVAILKNGPAAYFSTLPLESLLEVETPFPKKLSLSAGAYVCNFVMYRLLDYLNRTKVKGGFVHLPELNGDRERIYASIIKLLQGLK
jgi:pyroglutamyl-peptidase